MARSLRMTEDERDHLFHLGGQIPPVRHVTSAHVSAGMLHLLDRLTDSPAFVVNDLEEVSLVGDLLAAGPEFATLWAEHDVAVRRCARRSSVR
jgi:hypothetical protein